MRRKVVVLFVAVLAVFFFTKPLILFIAKKQLQGVFPHSKVYIQKCQFLPHRLLSFSGLEIKREKIYDFKIKEAKIYYSPFRLLRRHITKFYLGEAQISINMGEKSIAGFASYMNLGPSLFLLKAVELSGLNIDLKSKEAAMTASISAELNPLSQSINYLNLNINSLDGQGAKIKNVSLKLNQGLPQDSFIEEIQFDKARIREVRGKTILQDKSFAIDSLSAKIFDGEVRGGLFVKLDNKPEYMCNLKFINIDLDRFASDFKLKEKLQISGKITGELVLKGSGADVSILSGGFFAVDPGGRLTIADDKLLKNVAQSSGQSMDILVESFKDYHYNTGIIKLSLDDKGNIVFNIALEGEAGKRNLSIVLHGFNLGSLISGN